MPDIAWNAVIAGMVSLAIGLITTYAARRGQAETNRLTGTNFEVERYNKFANEVQEERDAAKKELKEEREAHKNDIRLLRKDFEEFKISVHSQFSRYRAYIHGLRGQVHDLGGVPIEWPENLEQ